MINLPEVTITLQRWEKPSLTVLPISETQNGPGPGADAFCAASSS